VLIINNVYVVGNETEYLIIL